MPFNALEPAGFH